MNPFLLIACYEGIIYAGEAAERWDTYVRGRAHARNFGVPLLVVGCPKWGLHHGHGDATLDLEHKWWCKCPNPVIADIRTIDKRVPAQSIVIFSSHVLEHLTEDDAKAAMTAMNKAAIAQYHVYPSKLSLMAWCAPTHLSWPGQKNGQIYFHNREDRIEELEKDNGR